LCPKLFSGCNPVVSYNDAVSTPYVWINNGLYNQTSYGSVVLSLVGDYTSQGLSRYQIAN